MFDRFELGEYEESIEFDIIQAFGWAIIEFEAALYQKYLHLSGPSSVMTEDQFRKHLSSMHAKGHLEPLEFQGRRVWKKLIIESETEEEKSEEEIREILERARSKTAQIGQKRRTPRERLVTDSRALAEDILTIIKRKVMSGELNEKQAKSLLQDHIDGMSRALADSGSAFLRYIRKNLPSMSVPLEELLLAKGEDVLLLSLRYIRTG
jgi:polyhydroxyalkanoate synthesis regulator phasin